MREAPRAHEDEAERAVRAGIAAVGRLRRRLRAPAAVDREVRRSTVARAVGTARCDGPLG
ncbi:hypothetical protein [Bradyrhizobium sp. BR 1432]|uniref:hypothetical protein n=1 Tax=Bradyrhizobium sp. BR 1432 TaxID=3447966 RepID=UPI003EE6AEA5